MIVEEWFRFRFEITDLRVENKDSFAPLGLLAGGLSFPGAEAPRLFYCDPFGVLPFMTELRIKNC